jgi:hypothetical protein
VRRFVSRAIDFTDAAGAEPTDDFIGAEPRPWRDGMKFQTEGFACRA